MIRSREFYQSHILITKFYIFGFLATELSLPEITSKFRIITDVSPHM